MAVKVDYGNAAFLLMAKATVATTTVVSSSLGVGMTIIIPVLLLPQRCPGQQ
jgi:hypothetical protein